MRNTERLSLSVLGMLLISNAGCSRTDTVSSPEASEAVMALHAKTSSQQPMYNNGVASTNPRALLAYVATRESAIREFSEAAAAVTIDMIADVKANPMAYHPNPSDHSRGAQCASAKRAIAKFSPRLVALAKKNDLPVTEASFESAVSMSPVCRSEGPMSIFALPSMLANPAFMVVDEGLTEEQSAQIDQMLADSLTSAAYDVLPNFDLSAIAWGDSTGLKNYLKTITISGSSIDASILSQTKLELRNQYYTAWNAAWVGMQDPYMIFDPYFGWRWPTVSELWSYLGAGCTGMVGGSRAAIAAAARTGARAGAMASGEFVLLGAAVGAIAGAAGAAASACATGAVGGGAALVAMIASTT